MRVHTGEKRFKCEISLKQFTESGCLNKHLRIHFGEKPFNCKICSKQFVDCGRLRVQKTPDVWPHVPLYLLTRYGEKGDAVH